MKYSESIYELQMQVKDFSEKLLELGEKIRECLAPGDYHLTVSEDHKPWPQLEDEYWAWDAYYKGPTSYRWYSIDRESDLVESGRIFRTPELCSANHSWRVAQTALIKRRDELGGHRSDGIAGAWGPSRINSYWYVHFTTSAIEFGFENPEIGNQFCSEMSAELTAFFGQTPEQGGKDE